MTDQEVPQENTADESPTPKKKSWSSYVYPGLLLLVIGFFAYNLLQLFLYGNQVPEGWHNSVVSAHDQSQREKQPLLIYFSSNTCLPCVQLKKTTLVDPQVRQLILAGFTPLYLNVDEVEGGSPAYELMRQSQITGFPALRVMAQSGQMLESAEGFLDREQMLEFLNSAVEKLEKVEKLQ